MGVLKLKDMKFHAFHGCLEHEKQIGNTFLVNLELHLDTSEAEITDDINDTLNYQLIYDVVKSEMEIHSDLIEHVGRRIVDGLKRKFELLTYVKLEVEKMSPPLGGDVRSVSFILEMKK